MKIHPPYSPILVIGLGNASRGDDGVGPWLVHELRDLKDVKVLALSGEGTALMDAWSGADAVILMDAVQSGAPPGTIYRLDAHAAEIPSSFFHYSTHAFSLAEAIELARALDQLPRQVLIYGIEGASFQTGASLSPAVAAAAAQVAGQVQQEVQQLLTHRKNARTLAH